ncbi:helix-turn-helix domain-containing protein [Agromyces sp. Soil535]|uniref:winged helix-turn-helix transcriptional regulator n=1 Tax=Agromyces sp. Soil535 TaxID=1736390 RepID=UPI0009E8634E|nr:helix-turn-helix domain-containing protein [Agromyces sp. Soil535]
MKRADGRSTCPTNFTVETFGDSWSLLIMRDLLTLGKHTFGEFLRSEERIGPSVLADRLARLERGGIIVRTPSETDARKVTYSATERGIAAIPLLYEAARWGMGGVRMDTDDPWEAVMAMDRDEVLAAWHRAVREGGSLFGGEESAFARLRARERVVR